ncbi:MAG: peptidoglycan DD-metalloendopeptidase family protein [Nitrospiraceae bacterium]|nr:peptidoglycan DD-metalloendopeptidase family protein [Nitrospiraceae bacterium]
MIRYRWLLIPLALLLLQGHLFADALVQRELEGQQQRLKSLQKEIKVHEKKAADVELSRHSVLKELTDLDEKITHQEGKLQSTRKEWTDKELTLMDTQKDYKRQIKALNTLRHQVRHRLKAFMEMGTVGGLNVLFAADTVPELLSRETYFRHILDHDRKLRDLYRSSIKKTAKKAAELQRQREALKKADKQIEKQSLLLEEQKQAKQAFLDELRQQGKRYGEMLAKLKGSERSLQDIIARLSRHEDIHLAVPDRENSFEAQKGKLNPPVIGQLLKKGIEGRKGPGVIFAAPWGAEIRSIFDGTVVYKGDLRGYGKVLIIDHGEHYFSLIAQGAKFFKDVGEKVTEGEIIGLVGGGPWVQEGIYFEIRHGEKEEDPMKWLDLTEIEIGHKS